MSVLIVIGVLFSVAYFILLRSYKKLWKRAYAYNQLSSQVSVAVLVPFRDEEKALPALLSSFGNLNLANISLEFLFIDDHSKDESVPLVSHFLKSHKGKLLHLTSEYGKKSAISLAWENVDAEILVQTDADCAVLSTWLQELVAPFDDLNVKLVSGPVNFAKETNFWKSLVALDFAGLIAIGAAHISWQKPLICNGANLAYRKEVIKNANLKTAKASGEDVFLLESVSRHYGADSIVFCKNENAMVTTEGPRDFTTFWNQRLRWASKNGDYADKRNVSILAFVWGYNISILLLVFSFHPVAQTLALFMVLIKVLAEISFYTSFQDFFGIRKTEKNLILGQPFHICYMALMPLFSLTLKYRWKERKQK